MITSKRSLLILVTICVLLILLLATAVKALWNELNAPKVGIPPCESIGEAKRRGTLVCKLDVKPSSANWDDRTGNPFKEAWIEEVAEKRYFLVWFSYYEKKGGYYLCLRLPDEYGSNSTIKGGKYGGSFMVYSGEGFCYQDVENGDPSFLKMDLRTDRNKPVEDVITFSAQ